MYEKYNNSTGHLDTLSAKSLLKLICTAAQIKKIKIN